MSLPAPELQQLHSNILDYLTKRSRIMSALNLNTWDDFVAYYNYQYSDYSREDLRDEFLATMLPKIFTYNLTDIQRRKIEIFATHYHFKRNEEGFVQIPRRDHLPIEGVHYVTSEDDTREFIPATPTSDQKINAWASVINSSDAEVACYSLYRGTRLRKRVAQTWEQFQQTGDLPDNLQPTIARKIVGFRTKAEKLSAILNNSLSKEHE